MDSKSNTVNGESPDDQRSTNNQIIYISNEVGFRDLERTEKGDRKNDIQTGLVE